MVGNSQRGPIEPIGVIPDAVPSQIVLVCYCNKPTPLTFLPLHDALPEMMLSPHFLL